MKEGPLDFSSPSKREWNTSLGIKSSYLMIPLHGQAILLILIKLDFLVSCLAKRHKRKRLLGGNPRCFFTFSFSVLDVCYYYINIIVSLFSSFVRSFSLRLQESSKVVTCCLETDYVPLTEKLAKNHQIIFLI